MKLKALSLADLEQVRLWRNEQSEHLRTAFPLTAEMQEEFYRTVICNRQTNARYWGIWWDCGDLQPDDCLHLIGMGGIENIQWETRIGEISLLLDSAKDTHWEKALIAILDEGFKTLNLENLFTEVYECSPFSFRWNTVATNYDRHKAELPARKYYKGIYYKSDFITFRKRRVFP